MSAGDQIVQILTDTVDQWLVQVCEDARPRAVAELQSGTPVRTGYLRDQEDSAGSGGGGAYEATFYSRAEYSSWVDEGRGPIGPFEDGRVLHFTVGGKDVFVRSVGPAEGRHFFNERIGEVFDSSLQDSLHSLPIGG